MSEQMKVEEVFEEKGKLKLIDLNKDCLIKLCRFLTHQDLLRLRKVHQHFHNAVDYVSIVNGRKSNKAPTLKILVWEVKLIEEYLQLFGKQIEYLKINLEDCDDSTEKIFKKSIENHCGGGNIKHCSFTRFTITESFFNKNKSFFNGLETLEIYLRNVQFEVDLRRFMGFVAKSNLKEFRLSGYKSDVPLDIFPYIAASKLEVCKIRFRSNSMFCNVIEQDTEMPKNLTLKTLDIAPSQYDPAIIRHFPNIENLRILLQHDRPLEPMKYLLNLKELSLQMLMATESIGCLSILAKPNKLEILTLYTNRWNPNAATQKLFAETLKKMTNLRKLDIHFDFYDFSYLKEIGRNLTNLDSLRIFVRRTKSACNVVIETMLEFAISPGNLKTLILELPIPEEEVRGLYDEIVSRRQAIGFNKPIMSLDSIDSLYRH